MAPSVSPIRPHRPPWLRSLYEAEQLMALSIGDDSVPVDAMSIDEVGSMLDDPETVVWIWNDLRRSDFTRIYGSESLERSGDLSDLSGGRHVEVFAGGRSGLPSVIFPTTDPEMFVEAQPFQKQELVGSLHNYEGHYIDRIAPLDVFTVGTSPD